MYEAQSKAIQVSFKRAGLRDVATENSNEGPALHVGRPINAEGLSGCEGSEWKCRCSEASVPSVL